MASPARMSGFTTALNYNSTFGGGYTPLSSMMKITSPKAKVATVKTNDLGTLGTATGLGAVNTYQRGLADCGQLDAVAFFTQSQYATLLSFFEAGTELYWQIVLPKVGGQGTGANIIWPGFVMELGIDEINTDDENLVMLPFSIKVNDYPSYTAGA